MNRLNDCRDASVKDVCSQKNLISLSIFDLLIEDGEVIRCKSYSVPQAVLKL